MRRSYTQVEDGGHSPQMPLSSVPRGPCVLVLHAIAAGPVSGQLTLAAPEGTGPADDRQAHDT